MKLEIAGLALTGFALLAEFMRNPCVDAGLIPPLVQLLNCKDQEVLLQTGRALGNICYDSRECWNLLYFVHAPVEGRECFGVLYIVCWGVIFLFSWFLFTPQFWLYGKIGHHTCIMLLWQRLKHLFNIVIQLDIRIERLFDPGFGLLGGGFSNIMNWVFKEQMLHMQRHWTVNFSSNRMCWKGTESEGNIHILTIICAELHMWLKWCLSYVAD